MVDEPAVEEFGGWTKSAKWKGGFVLVWGVLIDGWKGRRYEQVAKGEGEYIYLLRRPKNVTLKSFYLFFYEGREDECSNELK